jgi:hypothetical protein
MMDHKGRRFKKLFAKQPTAPQEAESPQEHLPQTEPGDDSLRRFSHTSAASNDISDELVSTVPRRSSTTHQSPDRKKLSTGERTHSLSPQRSDSRRASEPVTQLQLTDSNMNKTSRSATMEEDPRSVNSLGHVRFSEEVADHNLDAEKTDHLESPPLANQNRLTGSKDLISELRRSEPSDGVAAAIHIPQAATETRDESTPEEPAETSTEEDRQWSSNPYSNIDSYDRKFSQPNRGSQASNVYVRAGRKPTRGLVGAKVMDDDSDSDLETRETRRKSVVFAQELVHERPDASARAGSLPRKSTTQEDMLPSFSESANSQSTGRTTSNPRSLLDRTYYPITTPENSADVAADPVESADSKNLASSSSSSALHDSNFPFASNQTAFPLKRPDDKHSLEEGSGNRIHSSSKMNQGEESSVPKIESSWPQELTSHTTSATLQSNAEFSPSIHPYSRDGDRIVNYHNTATTDARSADWGPPRSTSSHVNDELPNNTLRPQWPARNASGTTTGGIYGGSCSQSSSEESLDQGPVTPPNKSINDKPLPRLPTGLSAENIYTMGTPPDEKMQAASREYVPEDSSQSMNESPVMNLSNTTDTDVTTHITPPVTDEIVHPVVHHVPEEQITREIHNHDVFHRILPIHETEILPTRHFVHNPDNDLVEVPATAIPGRTLSPQNWSIKESPVSPLPEVSSQPRKRRPFTARWWYGTDGDHKDYVDEDGIHKTETTWVHPPVLEEGGKLSGQTKPMYFDDMAGLIEKTPERMPGGWQFDGVSDDLERKSSLKVQRKPIEGSEEYVKFLESKVT